MPIFNYVREHRRFIRYASDNKLTSSERLLWYALIEVINEESESNVWTDEFIRISNGRLLMLCDPMGIDTMVRARNGLKQRGLIEFRPGNKNKENPAYRVKLFYPDGYTQNADKNECYTQNAYNMGGNIGVNIGGNIRGNMGGNTPANMGNIYINQNKGYTGTETKNIDEEEIDDGVVIRAREDEEDVVPDRPERENEIIAAFARSFGRRPYPAELNRLVWVGHAMKFVPVMVARASEIAAEEGAKKPVQYVLTILDDWQSEHVMQPHQIEGYQWDEDIRRGKAPIFAGTGDSTEDWKIREEHRRERQQENIDAGIEKEGSYGP